MVPERIQLQRTKGWRKPEGAVVVSRPSYWGNPWKIGSEAPLVYGGGVIADRARAVDIFRQYVEIFPVIARDARRYLAGRDLACWCPLEDSHGNAVPCHANVLLELANSPERSTSEGDGGAEGEAV